MRGLVSLVVGMVLVHTLPSQHEAAMRLVLEMSRRVMDEGKVVVPVIAFVWKLYMCSVWSALPLTKSYKQ